MSKASSWTTADRTQQAVDEHFMRAALAQAKKAFSLGEVPIGCVIVYDGRIIGRGYNRRNTDHTTLSHAEIRAIRKATKVIGDWRLDGCTLYCTLEPCPMCAGAIEQARIDRVVIGAPSDKSGCAGTLLNIVANEKLMHQSQITRDVLREECSGIISAFFRSLRQERKEERCRARIGQLPCPREVSAPLPSTQDRALQELTDPI